MIVRIVDILVSLFGLLILFIMLPFIGLLIKLDSRGPVFYQCDRVGLNGRIFKMYKIRTMYDTPVEVGPSLSPQRDPRVTPVGRVLRRLKLNEFPQFINVLKGDMTLVGPRPETPDLAERYPEEAKVIFTVKPGLVGPNQILGRNEEELYPPGVDPVEFYFEHILPAKIPVDVEFIKNQSLFKNLKYLFLGGKVTVTVALSRQHLLDNRSQIYLMMADMALCLLSFSLAYYLRYESIQDPACARAFLRLLPWAVLVRLPLFVYFGFYHTLIRHLSLYDVKRIFKGVTISSVIFLAISFLSGITMLNVGATAGAAFSLHTSFSRKVFLIDWLCLVILLVGMRAVLKKLYRRYRIANGNGDARSVIIWGAGDGGELCLQYLRKNQDPVYNPVGFIDDDPLKRGRRLNGVKVLGDRHHLKILTQLYKIQEVFIAISSASPRELHRIMETCWQMGLEIRMFHFDVTPYAIISSSRLTAQDEVKSRWPKRQPTKSVTV